MTTSRTPKSSPITVTYSNSHTWQDIDEDVHSLWPGATGYVLTLLWPDDMGGRVAFVSEVFGVDTSHDIKSVPKAWIKIPGAFVRAQAVFLMPDILDEKPDVLYRVLGAPDPNIVEACVKRHGKGVS